MTLRVFMMPAADQAVKDTTNSINRIVLYLQKYLPSYDCQIVDDPNKADIVAAHAGMAPLLARGRACVAHCHGLYPTAYQDQVTGWHWEANRGVVENVIGARRVTVPSQWVADIFRRDMHFNPDVIGWGVELGEWSDSQPLGYILWNKTRTDGVCSPVPLNQLAQRLPEQQFVTTYAAPGKTANIYETGRVTYDKMREMVKGASVYLATTKETFGIGTLEAMACGVPVLGFRHGATPDLIRHGETGYLVDPGDYDGLVDGLAYCLEYRECLGSNAREAVREHSWDNVASQFADLYREAIKPADNPRVSIVIPCYNYARYVEEAISTAVVQRLPDGSMPEIIVVNDGSTDDSSRVARQALHSLSRGVPWRVIDQENSGVAAARNAGIAQARGEYVVCLDADDRIEPKFVDTCTRALDGDRSLGIVFTSLQMLNAEGIKGSVTAWPDGYDFDIMARQSNQVPTCCMFRRVAWERAGGFRAQYSPAEDAELWTRIGALGWRAQHCSKEPLFLYRLHEGSLSHAVRTGAKVEPNWHDKTWMLDGQRPFASDGKPPFHSWPVRNFDRPKVSIVVPVGAYHRHQLSEALDSIENQSERAWECIVVNDTGSDLSLAAYPWVRIVTTEGKRGPSHARNQGIAASRAPLIAFLDADDIFHPDFLRETLKTYAVTDKYVYTDWVSQNKDGLYEPHVTPEYDPNEVFQKTSIHSINILIPRKWLLQIGGFDEGMNSWEDTDLFMKLAAAGLCGARCPKALTLYRYTTGQLREDGFAREASLKTLLRERYAQFITGGQKVACCGAEPKPITNGALQPNEGIRIVYAGPPGAVEVVGTVTHRSYGRRALGDIFYVFGADQQANPKLFVPVIDPTEQVQPTSIPPAPQYVSQKVMA
jgi:glycosyltransferase involved in cell wall biosynthesis